MASTFLPHFSSGTIIKGFGRGSKQLGIPTANFDEEIVNKLPKELPTGIYYGFASIDATCYKMVMSIGWNPFYQNEKKSMETHIIHKFDGDLYGKVLNVIILGFLRPEKDFATVDELIEAIKCDIHNAEKCLDDEKYQKYKNHEFLKCNVKI